MNNERKIINQERSGVNSFLAKMYAFMAGAVGISAFVAYLINNVYYEQTMTFIAQNRFMLFVLIGLQFFIALSMSFKANRAPAITGLGLVVFAAIQGLFFGIVLSVYTAADVTMAFVAAAAVFLSMATIGTVTKRDLSKIGTQALAALIGLVVVSVINIFLQSTMIQFVFSFFGVLIFTALTAWDAQKFKLLYQQTGAQVSATNLALMGALQLYLDFVNLFISLLNIFTGFNNK
ncbi:Bax inhibitor-1/YccA family protein [Liquorilactobacillus satsumensis]|uniref:Integral membrane protein n=1 Tax=Liquorilactobacillus satsumensis DSM 16230 = JCM 12392 TaxID=1423801 RepID=A0A0R1V2T5_9LACO|nr:Bax inhibitor-1/YccA family protein [Liquorilactobacillus satsumensis]KRL99830.1 integral membrane protein [Liquorilactobacillus satsumensis DSM 16230 = JCM 12392]MCC7665680.1 BAX inhibitor (BI)-1/YccA family protein [Liquorilactobacillus satsumensis]MCP9311892.1 Bax inhibitor-1/YccA family protein [Liquorilactobacillus satsumensis]MCP9328308.1 Bax inhibitor-1/YccA family protein [Liquorilactobacillus satsumensis]MCP9356527.1 Bax inhibitor-1/YccA family protein [Liquorilactobacillus satsume